MLSSLRGFVSGGQTARTLAGRIDHLAPGEYWLTTLDNEAVAGDVHIRWDLPVHVSAGRSAADLSSINGIEPGTP